jgi:bifunctional non-homologous end joining protein LigD
MAAGKNSPEKSLKEYRAKRDFRATPEPGPGRGKTHKQPIFVIQKHAATRLHYDFRLEAGGVLKSWVVTNEPSLDPAMKRLAVRVEDHPIDYANFSGEIPRGLYGAGHVDIWDHGTYELPDSGQTVEEGLAGGKFSFILHGKRLKGRFALVRMRGNSGKKENWLLIKLRDEFAKSVSLNGSVRATRRESAKPRPSKTGASTKWVVVAPKRIAVTHPNKVLFPDSGITKADVVEYYRKVAKRLLPFLRVRPVTLERLPDGLGPDKPHFWQKNTPETYPAWIPRLSQTTVSGRPVAYVLVNDLSTLLYLVNQGTVTFHPWLSRVDDLDRPDFVLFDLDKGTAPFTDVVAVAKKVREALADDGFKAFVKTSGKSGLHVLVPWAQSGDFDSAREWAAGIAGCVADALPRVTTTDIRKAKRGGRVYVDVMQNARGHHAVPPYVLRAVSGAPASTPLHWREVTPDLDPARFNLRTVPARIARQKRDPMAPLLRRPRATSRSA